MKPTNIIILTLLVIIVNLVFFNVFSHKEMVPQYSDMNEQGTREVIDKKIAAIYPVHQNKDTIDSDYRIQRRNAVTEAVKKTEASVVSVNVIKTQIVRRYTNPFDNPFFGFFDYRPYRREVQSIGSGIIYSTNGYIITNAHVVEGATQIKVVLNDGRQLEAEIAGVDNVLDIAVLKTDNKGMPAITLGRTDDLILGETVIAIGNPYAFLIKDSKPSVSVGVISAINRNFSQDSEGKVYQGMIQTDAAINPGNSGGPLINILGEAIGMNAFIFSESGGSIGVGFAIPMDRVKRVAEEIIKYGRRRQIWFGFKVQDLNPMIAQYLKLDNLNGVIISFLEDNSPAFKAGLRRGDIIVRINGSPINNTSQAEIAILGITIGDEINLEIMRDKKKLSISFQAVESK